MVDVSCLAMRPIGILLMALCVVSACVLVAGCTSPGGNATQQTTPPTETMTGTPTPTATMETTMETPTTEATTAAPNATVTTETAMETTTTEATTAALNATVTETTSASGAGNQSITVDLTAQNVAFDTSTIAVPAGAEVTVQFTNLDSVPHNFAVYETSQANEPIFVGEIINEGTTTYTFTAPSQPGTYFFRCDVHPQTMTGDFIVQ